MFRGSARGASTVVGVLLLVGVVVIVGGVVALGALTFLDGTGAPQATADFSYERTPAGLEMSPNAISTTVTVQLNGRDVATFEPDSAGQSVLLPTAPGDRITVVSTDGERSVLVDRTVEGRSQIGDFIAHYTFEAEDGDSTLEDRSNNDNDGTLNSGGNTRAWTGSSYEFGGNDYFTVSDIEAPGGDVEEFTIAVAYRTNDGDSKQELVEHINGEDNWGLEIKTGSDTDTYEPVFFVDDSGGNQNGQIRADPQTVDERTVIVGTHDGNSGETRLYVDGEFQGERTYDSSTTMGQLFIGRDAERSDDYLDGEIYEIRLYYTAFDDEEVEVVTNAMN